MTVLTMMHLVTAGMMNPDKSGYSDYSDENGYYDENGDFQYYE